MKSRSLKAGWKMVKFGDVVKNINLVERDPAKAGIDRIVGLEHIDPENLHVKRWDIPENGTSFTRKFVPGQTLFGKRRAYQRKVAFAEFEGICSGDILTFESKNPKILLPELLPFICQTDEFFNHALGTSAGSLSPRTSWSALQNFEFPLPPLDEQKHIAEILWAADEAVEKYATLTKEINQYVEAVIEKNLTSTDSGSVLGDYCPSDGVRIGPFGSLLHAKDYQSQGIPVVMPADIEDGVIQKDKVARISFQKAKELENYCLCENDILLPRRGDLAKRAIVLKPQAGWLCGTGTIRIRLKDGVNPHAVFLAVTSASANRWLNRFAVGTTMPNLNASTIKKMPLHLPDRPTTAALVDDLKKVLDVLHRVKKHYQSLVNLRQVLVETKIMEGAAHV
ncbi:MAG: restriction endonuclease subunit S [Nitrospirota bacterium]|nr:restriction endonuclease subunit S [Nitrospirota bacterium]